MKPGMKTTELWLNAAAMVLATLTASGMFTQKPVVMAMTIAGIVLSSIIYTISRSMVKAAEIKAAGPEGIGPSVVGGP